MDGGEGTNDITGGRNQPLYGDRKPYKLGDAVLHRPAERDTELLVECFSAVVVYSYSDCFFL